MARTGFGRSAHAGNDGGGRALVGRHRHGDPVPDDRGYHAVLGRFAAQVAGHCCRSRYRKRADPVELCAQGLPETRILVLFDPSIDVEQSRQATYGKIAIGSGQFTGQGWTNGTMTQMQYVPENQTDYIFSVAGEELGFLGCLLIIILLMALIIRLFYVAYRASTPFRR